MEQRPGAAAPALDETPLVVSRVLGALLGLRALHFKLETGQPTGSWVDRSAAGIVASAVSDGVSGLCAVGVDAVAVALAAECARVGLPLIVLQPANDATGGNWPVALGARLVCIQGTLAELEDAAAEIALNAGLYLVQRDAPTMAAGLLAVVREIAAAGRADDLLALPQMVGDEGGWLAPSDHRQAAIPLPFDLPGPSASGRLSAVVGTLDGAPNDGAPGPGVVQQAISRREAEAAQRLLAQEEGLLASAAGAAGLAALIRLRQADQQLRPRERRLPGDLAAVVIVARALASEHGPPLAPGSLPASSCSLSEARSGLARELSR